MIKVQTLDRKIWRKDLLFIYLYDCYIQNKPAVIDFCPEGSCADCLGLYRLLDEFCAKTGYPKNNITIKTANMIEQHDEYVISKQASYWYEIGKIQDWLKDKTITSGTNPTKHFSNFTSRSNWARLWLATILDKNYSTNTLQTYHYDPNRPNYNFNGYIGLDDLIKFNCDVIGDAVKFIETCPRTIDIDYLENLDNCKNSIFQHENSYYPIQHPSNLNLLQYYRDVFVDIVVEPNVSGNCFLSTEKIWRPIIARRPFIVLSNMNYLQNLQKLGFKTFNHWWSEEYDMYSEADRIQKISQILKTISFWSVDELQAKLVNMQDTLDHNYKTFINLSPEQLLAVFDQTAP
jgi:hypothetical protein